MRIRCGVIILTCVIIVVCLRQPIISEHAEERMKERGVARGDMISAAKYGDERKAKRGCTKRCKDGVCAIVSPPAFLKRPTILTTYFDT